MNLNLDCLATYQAHGIRFAYPDVWTLDEQQEGDDVMLTVSTDGTCFWALRLLPGCPSPPAVIQSCVDAFRQEYGTVEVEETTCHLADMPASSQDLRFECLELLNTACLRCVRTTEFTVLVWWQGTDHELETIERVFQAMTSSVGILSLQD